MFNFLKNKIKKIYTAVTKQVSSIFNKNQLDEQFLKELSALLIAADTGVQTTNAIIKKLTDDINTATITTMEQAKAALEQLLLAQLATTKQSDPMPSIVLLVGVNGSGKTSFIAKYANLVNKTGKRLLVVAGDTFRAAATQQLAEWTKRIGAELFVGKENQDPSAVIFDACKKCKDEHFDHLIIDTAGRLQTKVNLMHELEKIRRTIHKQLPNQPVSTWLTIDAMLGQNSLAQAEIFHQATPLDGLILTKLDGTGKGGIVFAITHKLQIPIIYVTFGETIDDIEKFNPQEYVHNLLTE